MSPYMGDILSVDFNSLINNLRNEQIRVRNEREPWLSAAVWCLCIRWNVTF